MILPTYHITQNTLAILPAKQLNYDTIIIEQQTTKHIQQTPLSIIKSACEQEWSTYDGRRQAISQQMNFKQKVPIPTSIINKHIFFPTHSPHHLDNNWIAAHHITHIKRTTKHQSTLQFTNGQILTLDTSYHTLHQQTKRAFACLYQISNNINIQQNQIDHQQPSPT